MKKSTLAATLLLTSISVTSISANAATTEPLTMWEKTGVFSSTMIVGTVVGGPIGLVLGLAAGDWINKTWNSAINSEQLTLENQHISKNLVTSELQRSRLHNEVLTLDQQVKQISEAMLVNQQHVQQALQLDLLFSVNQSTLDLTNQARLIQVTNYLIAHPSTTVILSGYADQSGNVELNTKLAEQRVLAVQEQLILLMVANSQIHTQSFGATKATAQLGDLAQYPKDRKVSIEFMNNNEVLISKG